MLSQEDNNLFTSVKPGTPMGDLLRRYWHPVGASEQITSKPQRMTVLNEELMLYRGASGQPVLMQLRCAHRSLALDYGRVEGDSIRCPYHGWLYDQTGQCTAQPAEPEGSSFKEKVKLKTYPVQEVSGLVFAYMGPLPAPVLPLYDVLRMEDGVKAVQMRYVNANFFNHVENIVDVSHLAWLHGYAYPAYGGKKVTYHWEPQSYGVDNVMLIDGLAADDEHVSCYAFPTVNRFSVSPVEPGGPQVQSILYRVPIDDTKTKLYFVRFYASDKRTRTVMERQDKLGEYKASADDWWGIDVSDHDRMAIEQQGIVADRPNEHLGVSDGGIILMRKMMRDALAAVKSGQDPFGVIRDASKQNVDFGQKAAAMDERREGGDYAGGLGQVAAE